MNCNNEQYFFTVFIKRVYVSFLQMFMLVQSTDPTNVQVNVEIDI